MFEEFSAKMRETRRDLPAGEAELLRETHALQIASITTACWKASVIFARSEVLQASNINFASSCMLIFDFSLSLSLSGVVNQAVAMRLRCWLRADYWPRVVNRIA